MINTESDNEVFVEVEFSNGVLASAEKIERKCDEKLGGKGQIFPEYMAVSYTHLDVYKRQNIRSINTDNEKMKK